MSFSFVDFTFIVFLVGAAKSQDNRCFLRGGGSTLSFFVKESLPVGSAVGRLDVQGTPGVDVDLELDGGSFSDDPWPVPIRIEDSNLILAEELDKESVAGPSSFNINVRCNRLNATDPEFTIPVSIHVTDVNDNTPEFVDSPYRLNISELTIVGTRIFSEIKAVDKDQPGPFSTVEYSIKPGGRYSEYVAFENPLEGSLVLTKHLDYESLRNFKVEIVARDQGVPGRENETVLTIEVQDADDQNPAFFYETYDALIPRGDTVGQKLPVQPQDIKAFDKDIGLNSPVFYTFARNDADEYRYFELNRNTGHIYIMSSIPATDFLQPVTLVVRATQYDNPDRNTVTTLTLSRGGIFDSDLQYLQHNYDVKILENAPLNSPVATLLTNKPLDRRVKFAVDEKSLPEQEFTVTQQGEVMLRKSLDYERQSSYSFSVSVTDGRRNDTARVNVTVLNINDWDPRFKYPLYEFTVDKNNMKTGGSVGKLEVFDGDKGDETTLMIRGRHSRLFKIDEKGNLFVADTRFLNGTEAHIVVVAKDSGIPARQTSVPIVVHFPQNSESSKRTFEDDAVTLAMSLGLVTAVFLIIIITLIGYICKSKRKNRSNFDVSRASPNSMGSNNNTAVKNYLPHADGSGPMMPTDEAFHHRSEIALNDQNQYGAMGSVDLLNRLPSQSPLNPLNPNHRSTRLNPTNGSVIGSSRVSPIHIHGLPQRKTKRSFSPKGSTDDEFPGDSLRASTTSLTPHQRQQHLLREAIFGDNIVACSRSDVARIEWPRNSIPRRIKKLSWEDENELGHDRDISTLTDPNVSVTPMHINNDGVVGRSTYF